MTKQDNFLYLTFSLILLLLATALAQQFFDDSIQRLVQSCTVVTLLVAVWGADRPGIFKGKAFLFPVAIIISTFMSYWLDFLGLGYIHLILLLLFFVFTAWQTAKQVLFSGDIDGNKILGAICLYMLMGLIFALIFTLMELNFNQSFQGIHDHGKWYELFPNFIYFSFVTLTTLGFGDISPALPVARFFVYGEAVLGQFYLTILVASLVGARMSIISEQSKATHGK